MNKKQTTELRWEEERENSGTEGTSLAVSAVIPYIGQEALVETHPGRWIKVTRSFSREREKGTEREREKKGKDSNHEQRCEFKAS